MINGGYPETPDAWIERSPYDEPHDPDAADEPNEDAEDEPRAIVTIDGDAIKFQSTTQPDLYFWAEHATPDSFMAVAQVDGYPGTEAHGDWFAHERDANHIALLLAEGQEL